MARREFAARIGGGCLRARVNIYCPLGIGSHGVWVCARLGAAALREERGGLRRLACTMTCLSLYANAPRLHALHSAAQRRGGMEPACLDSANAFYESQSHVEPFQNNANPVSREKSRRLASNRKQQSRQAQRCPRAAVPPSRHRAPRSTQRHRRPRPPWRGRACERTRGGSRPRSTPSSLRTRASPPPSPPPPRAPPASTPPAQTVRHPPPRGPPAAARPSAQTQPLMHADSQRRPCYRSLHLHPFSFPHPPRGTPAETAAKQ